MYVRPAFSRENLPIWLLSSKDPDPDTLYPEDITRTYVIQLKDPVLEQNNANVQADQINTQNFDLSTVKVLKGFHRFFYCHGNQKFKLSSLWRDKDQIS